MALELGVFGDAGWAWSNRHRLDHARLLADMGFVLRCNIPYRPVSLILGDCQLRIFFPFWVSDPPPGFDRVEFRRQIAFADA